MVALNRLKQPWNRLAGVNQIESEWVNDCLTFCPFVSHAVNLSDCPSWEKLTEVRSFWLVVGWWTSILKGVLLLVLGPYISTLEGESRGKNSNVWKSAQLHFFCVCENFFFLWYAGVCRDLWKKPSTLAWQGPGSYGIMHIYSETTEVGDLASISQELGCSVLV